MELRKFYVYNNQYEVKDGQPTKLNTHYDESTVQAYELLYKEKEDTNIWNDSPIKLQIFGNKDGIGYEYEVPDGYSSYTFDPDVVRGFYKGADLDWFMRNVLDQEQRDMLSVHDVQTLESLVRELTNAQTK